MSRVSDRSRTATTSSGPRRAKRAPGGRTRLIWSFAIGEKDTPSLAKGYVLAPTEEAAVALVGHPQARVWPYPGRSWPGPEGEIVCTILDPYELVGQRRSVAQGTATRRAS